jgi:hypothetical protein
MRTRIMQVAPVLGVVIVLAGCRSGLQSTPETRAVVSTIPDWMTKPPTSDNALLAAATAESRDLQLAIDKAQAAGRAQIAQQMESKFEGLAKRFQEETGLVAQAELLDQFNQTYKLVVSQELTGTHAKEQRVLPSEGIYRAYVLMEMPIGEANKALLAKLATKDALNTLFRATQAYKELNEEIQKYEQSKKPPQ